MKDKPKMKLLSNFFILGTTFAQESSGDGAAVVLPKNVDFDILAKSPLVSLELVEPLYQECEAPEICLNKIPARYINLNKL